MPDLSFKVEGASSVAHAAAPMLAFHLRIANQGAEPVHSIALRCQVMIEPARRRYAAGEQELLKDLFGEPERWSQTVRPMLWTHTTSIISAFDESTQANLQIPCSFDFNIAATKYFYGLADGIVPLCLQFSGSIFYSNDMDALQVCPISWTKEARFELPVGVWKEMMDVYYPNSAWLRVRQDIFDRIYRFKIGRGIPTWEETFQRLLLSADEVVQS